jgi:hypothetical protein
MGLIRSSSSPKTRYRGSQSPTTGFQRGADNGMELAKHWSEYVLHMPSELPSISLHKGASCGAIKSCHLQVYAYFFEVLPIA